jgi:hypothetical protein
VETGNMTVSKFKEMPKTPTVSNHSLESSKNNYIPTSHEQSKEVIETALSIDESWNQSHVSSCVAQDEAIGPIAKLISTPAEPSVSSSGVDKYAVVEHTNEEIMLRKGTSPHEGSARYGVEHETNDQASRSRLKTSKLTTLPSFDEPGQITAKILSDDRIRVRQENYVEPTATKLSDDTIRVRTQNSIEMAAKKLAVDRKQKKIEPTPKKLTDNPSSVRQQNRIEPAAKKLSDDPVRARQQKKIEPTVSEAVEPPSLTVGSARKQGTSVNTSTETETCDEAYGPEDERNRVVKPFEGIGPSLTFLEATIANENESPTNENGVSSNGNWNTVPSNVSSTFLIRKAESSDGSAWSQEATVVVKNEDSQKDDFDVEEPGIIMRRRSRTPTFEKHHRAPVQSPKPLDDIPLKTSMVRRFVNRPILEETSKANVRTEIYETNIASESTEKASRELRKDRIRSFEPARLSVPVIPATGGLAPLPEPNHTTQSGDITTGNSADTSHRPRSKEIPDLDELMEFHSCDEDFFTAHTDSEPFSTGFA